MKEKIALVLSVLMVMLTFGACGTDPKSVDYNGSSYSDLLNENIQYAYLLEQIEAYIEGNNWNADELTKDQIKDIDSKLGAESLSYAEAAVNWINTKEEYGDCSLIDSKVLSGSADLSSLEYDEDNFSITKSGKTLTSDFKVKFGKKDVIFEVVYNYSTMEVTGITLNPVETLGTKMRTAGLNTLMSLGIVFSVLILISLLIYGFKIFPYLEKKKQDKVAASKPEVEMTKESESVNVEEVVSEDSELVAVIAAAIAASEGTSTSDFVVRSINRR